MLGKKRQLTNPHSACLSRMVDQSCLVKMLHQLLKLVYRQGPFANGATSPPIDPEVASTLPMVKSTSLTTIPEMLNLTPSLTLRISDLFKII